MLTCSTRSISPWEPRRTARLRRWNTPLRLNVRCVRNFVLMWTTADWFVKIRSTWNGRWWSGERKPIPSMNWLIISIWAPQRAVASINITGWGETATCSKWRANGLTGRFVRAGPNSHSGLMPWFSVSKCTTHRFPFRFHRLNVGLLARALRNTRTGTLRRKLSHSMWLIRTH